MVKLKTSLVGLAAMLARLVFLEDGDHGPELGRVLPVECKSLSLVLEVERSIPPSLLLFRGVLHLGSVPRILEGLRHLARPFKDGSARLMRPVGHDPTTLRLKAECSTN
jgi:hypothetical protein